ncbi:hypothetical protein ACH5RR_023404 [Cinchona calisaya]|uniref:Uncharacterized protein n=1 Tax=Cinchona calisaya TaxID=153742 RepID=A0ABD2ZDR3_9GENT
MQKIVGKKLFLTDEQDGYYWKENSLGDFTMTSAIDLVGFYMLNVDGSALDNPGNAGVGGNHLQLIGCVCMGFVEWHCSKSGD